MKLAILDRDGTLNACSEDYVTAADQWTAEPGALEAIARLNHAGWHVAVATNQPGLGRGLLDVVALNAIHAKMHRQLAAVGGRIDAVFYCPHVPDDACGCRMPEPGLLEQIADRYGLEHHDVQVVGSHPDMLRAGAALGAQLHLICTGHSAHLAPGRSLPADVPASVQLHASLGAFADQLLLKPAQSPSPLAEPEA